MANDLSESKMVYKCCISSCGMSVRVVGGKGLSYHSFPTKEPNRDKWIQVILPHVEKPELFRIVQGYTRICSRHFKKKDYSMDSKKRARLSSNAVPSVFPGRDVKDTSLPTKVDSTAGVAVDSGSRNDSSTTSSSMTISPTEKKVPFTSWNYQIFGDYRMLTSGTSEQVPVAFDSTVTTLIDQQQSQPLSEDDTASSAFSSQEECCLSLPAPQVTKPSGKIRKRRKNRTTVPLALNSSKKRSSASEDLNIEGVGDAFAEINLSAFISASSDLSQELQGSCKRSSSSASSVPLDDMVQKKPALPLRKTEKRDKARSLPREEEESIIASLDSFSLKKDCLDPFGCEQELLQSIQAVSIGPNDETDDLSSTFFSTQTVRRLPELDSLTLSSFMTDSHDESLISGQLHDLYADLVNGGENLSLEDSSLTIFDSHLLIDALQGVEDFAKGTSIDDFARDLNSSLLDCTSSSMFLLNMNEMSMSDMLQVPFSIPGTDLLDKYPLPSEVPPIEQNPTKEDVPKPTPKHPSSSTTDVEDKSPRKSRKQSKPKEKITGSFSVERFGKSDKDIEYYTGFLTYEKFDAFFRSIDSYVENLKVTDMMHGVSSMGLTIVAAHDSSTMAAKSSAEGLFDPVDTSVPEEPKRRMSQGRSMSRMDELFMTIIRLRRKIPEKVLGHMFCISQPSVSRIIRAWTMLVFKILELPVEEKSGVGPHVDCSSDGTERRSHEKLEDGIPNSFRQLFYSDLAQSIISPGNVATNSRKTSSSTTCSNTSRSKRPKKEKFVIVVTEKLPSSPSSPAKATSNPRKTNSFPMTPSINLALSRELSEDDALLRTEEL